MARTKADSNESAPLRLRIPPSLAIAVLGGATTVAMSFAACESSPIPPPPVDAGQLEKRSDAGADTAPAQDDDPISDATISDATIEQMRDGTVDEPPMLVDAYVPPDTPHT